MAGMIIKPDVSGRVGMVIEQAKLPQAHKHLVGVVGAHVQHRAGVDPAGGDEEADDLGLNAHLRYRWRRRAFARTEAYRAFMDANRKSPLRTEMDAAEKAEKRAKDAYSQALQQEQKEPDNGNDTRLQAADGS